MSINSINRLTLFPLSPYGRRITAGGINADSSFRTLGTNFTPSYSINGAPSVDRTNDTFFFNIGSDLSLSQRPISSAQNTNQAYGFNLNGSNPISTPPVLTAATAPLVPGQYQKQVSYLALSDQNFTALTNDPLNTTFRIPQAGTGLKITTDGAGTILNTTVAPSFQRAGSALQAFDPSFLLANRTEVTQGATFKANPLEGGGVFKVDNPAGQNVGLRPNAQANNGLLQGPFGLQSRLGGLNPFNSTLGANGPKGLNGLGGADFNLGGRVGQNPLLDRLSSLIPAEQGLALTGVGSDVGVEQARLVATSRADLGLATDRSFDQNVLALKSVAAENNALYQAPTALQIAKNVDGFIPMAPALPAMAKSGAESGGLFNTLDQFSRAVATEVGDTASKKGGSGYVPFSFSGGGGGGSSAGQGQGQEQQRQPQKRLFQMA
ncbi:MAG: hypothetical protein KTR14_09340 [Vampirovibrio sp.]|nr:hypothetical protein [Vampirovibrio sp.]